MPNHRQGFDIKKVEFIEPAFCAEKCPNASKPISCPRNIAKGVALQVSKFIEYGDAAYPKETIVTWAKQIPRLSEFAAACAVRVEFLKREPLNIAEKEENTIFYLKPNPYAARDLTSEL